MFDEIYIQKCGEFYAEESIGADESGELYNPLPPELFFRHFSGHSLRYI